MSHFCVYVFGNPEDIESKLAPYDENMEVEKYKVEPVSEDEKLRFLNYYNEKEGNENEINLDSFETMYEKYGDAWNGNCWEKEEDIWYEFSTYNPNSKWDWWTAGGRWRHSVPTKDNSKSLDFVYAINEVDFAYSNIAPYAFIDTNGNWNEKGQMGWWGISNDNMSNEEWGEKFLEYVKSLPEDTLFTQIDCHI